MGGIQISLHLLVKKSTADKKDKKDKKKWLAPCYTTCVGGCSGDGSVMREWEEAAFIECARWGPPTSSSHFHSPPQPCLFSPSYFLSTFRSHAESLAR